MVALTSTAQGLVIANIVSQSVNWNRVKFQKCVYRVTDNKKNHTKTDKLRAWWNICDSANFLPSTMPPTPTPPHVLACGHKHGSHFFYFFTDIYDILRGFAANNGV